MNKPENWDQIEAFTGDFKNITPGGHVCNVVQATVALSSTGKEMLIILFDIAEGEFESYYLKQHMQKLETNPDAKWQGIYRQLTEGNGEKFFKGLVTAIENSNPGYTWQWGENTEKSLKGKLFGGVFGQEEYLNNNGEVKLSTKCMYIRSVEQIRKGVEVPKIKKLAVSGGGYDGSMGSQQVFPDIEIPF